MLNLLPIVEELSKKKQETEKKYQEEIANIQAAIDAVLSVNEACPNCEGKGKFLRHRVCAEDDRPNPNDPADWITCLRCDGTGYARLINNGELS